MQNSYHMVRNIGYTYYKTYELPDYGPQLRPKHVEASINL